MQRNSGPVTTQRSPESGTSISAHQTACGQFTVDPPSGAIITVGEVNLSTTTVGPGDEVRFRCRVFNIGTADFTGDFVYLLNGTEIHRASPTLDGQDSVEIQEVKPYSELVGLVGPGTYTPTMRVAGQSSSGPQLTILDGAGTGGGNGSDDGGGGNGGTGGGGGGNGSDDGGGGGGNGGTGGGGGVGGGDAITIGGLTLTPIQLALVLLLVVALAVGGVGGLLGGGSSTTVVAPSPSTSRDRMRSAASQ